MNKMNKMKVNLSKHNTAPCKWSPTCAAWPLTLKPCTQNPSLSVVQTGSPGAFQPSLLQLPVHREGWQGAAGSPQAARAAPITTGHESCPGASAHGQQQPGTAPSSPSTKPPGEGMAQAWQQWENCGERVRSCKRT